MKTIADWITKEEAARRLGVKPRSIAEYIAKGKLTPQKHQRPNVAGGAVNLFDPDQVDQLVSERAASKMDIVPALPPADRLSRIAAETRQLARTYEVDQPVPESMITTALLTAALRPAAPVSDTCYLTIDEASEYKGLSKSYIRSKLDGAPIGPHGRLVYRRDKLDKL